MINHQATDINFSDKLTIINVLKAIKANIDIKGVLEDQYIHLLSFIPNSEISDDIIKEFLAFFMSITSKEKIVEYSNTDINIAFI